MTNNTPGALDVIRLSKSVVGEAEQAAVATVIGKGFLGMGSETQAFEQELESYLGGGVSVTCVNTGTSALHLALQAVGVARGDEVLIPSLTFVGCFQAVSACGALPIACDVGESDGIIDLEDAAGRITDRTKAIMPVHYASHAGGLEAIYDLARRRGLRVIEDAAHSFGCTYKGRSIGSFGDVVCFSFDGIKNITSGEGGAVVTADREVAERVRDARLLGVMKDTEKRYGHERSWDFDVTAQGWRYHMSDLMAAIGRVQLKRFEKEFKPRRVELASHYRKLLSELKDVIMFDSDIGPVVPHIMPIRVLNDKRDAVRRALLDKQIQVGIHYKPNHLLSRYGGGSVSLPVVERLYDEILSLPLHPDLSLQQVELIVGIIGDCISLSDTGR